MRRKIIFIFFELSYLLGGAYSVMTGRNTDLGLIAFCMVFTFSMYYLVSHDIKPVDDGIYVTLCGFVFMASFLGSCLEFYELIPHYDDFLHLWSGVISAQIGFVLARYLWQPDEAVKGNRRIFLLMFVFFFTMGCASLWEIFEFGADRFLGLNMQAGGLEDTCIDMLDALAGCVVMLPYINSLINKIHLNK